MRKKRVTISDIIYKIIFTIALVVLIFSLGKLALIGWDYYSAQKEYRDLKSYVTIKTGNDSEQPDTQTASDEFQIDFNGLKKQNPDCIAWIRFPNLDINYPVVQGKDNDYYLKHTYLGEVKTAASIFVDYQNHSDFTDDNTFIYGHNMKDKSMFGHLNDYQKKDFYDQNPGFYLYTPDHTYYYEIFSCYVADVDRDADSFQIGFTSKQEYQSYIGQIQSLSLYDTGVKVSADNKILTLMTCNRAGYDHRFLVHAVQKENIQ